MLTYENRVDVKNTVMSISDRDLKTMIDELDHKMLCETFNTEDSLMFIACYHEAKDRGLRL